MMMIIDPKPSYTEYDEALNAIADPVRMRRVLNLALPFVGRPMIDQFIGHKDIDLSHKLGKLYPNHKQTLLMLAVGMAPEADEEWRKEDDNCGDRWGKEVEPRRSRQCGRHS